MANDSYRPEIDGLRAVAVLAVVLFHAGLGLPGGFVGVDVFFVISGFLVTGIIAKSLRRGDFSIRSFYVRRIRRIFPAAAFATSAVLIAGYFFLLPSQYAPVGEAALAQNVFASNIYFWFDTGYFSRDVLTKPLLHFWSLAVEEQFYLLFPLVLCVGFRMFDADHSKEASLDRRCERLAMFVLLLGVSSFVLSLYGTANHPSATFYLLPTRAWELMAGAWLALKPVGPRSQRGCEVLSALGAATIATSVFVISKQSHFPGFVALLPVLGTAFVIAATTERSTWVGNALSVRPAVFVGLISYSLYLWHWPLMAFARTLVREPSRLTMACLVIASIVISAASWRWIEQPIRRRKLFATDRRLLVASGFVWCALFVAASVIVRSGGIPNRFDSEERVLIQDAVWTGNTLASTTADVEADRIPMFGERDNVERPFLLWGDSHAMTWTDVVASASKELGRPGFAALHGGVPPIPGLWRSGMPQGKAFNKAVLDFIDRHEIKDVILVSRWSVYVAGYSASDPVFDGRRSDDVFLSDTAEASKSGEASLQAMIRGIESLAKGLEERGVRVWLIRQVPVQGSVVAENAVRNMLLGWDANPILAVDRESHREQQFILDRFYAAAESAIGDNGGVLDPGDLFFDDAGEGRVLVDGRYLFRDDDHLSKSGAEKLRSLIDRILTAQPQPEA